MARQIILCLVLLILDVCNVAFCRNVLDEFLMGNCRKEKYKAVKKADRPLRERITGSYIRPYIKEDAEIRSFDRYQRYCLFAFCAVPVKFVLVLVCILLRTPHVRWLLAAYALTILISMMVWRHEQNPHTKFTPHAGRRFRK